MRTSEIKGTLQVYGSHFRTHDGRKLHPLADDLVATALLESLRTNPRAEGVLAEPATCRRKTATSSRDRPWVAMRFAYLALQTSGTRGKQLTGSDAVT